MPNHNAGALPVYHIEELFPAQIGAIERLGKPAIIGSHGTAIFLADPANGVRPPHLGTVQTTQIRLPALARRMP